MIQFELNGYWLALAKAACCTCEAKGWSSFGTQIFFVISSSCYLVGYEIVDVKLLTIETVISSANIISVTPSHSDSSEENTLY